MMLETLPTGETLGHYAHGAIAKHLRKILKHEDDVFEDRDPEALHQMRVGMRRLRTAVAGFAPALELPKSAQEKQIAKIARCLGKLRDIDVLQEAFQNRYQPTLPKSEQKALDAAFDCLYQQREKALEQVREILSHKRYKQLKKSLQAWLKKPTYQRIAQSRIQEILPDLLLPQLADFFLHSGLLVGTKTEGTKIDSFKDLNADAIEEIIATQGELLHSLRKQAKRVRYQMELFTDFYGATYEAYLKDIKAIQEILGEIQDSFVLGEFLEDALQADIKKSFPTLAQQLAANRYQAWQEWQPLQRRYLNSQIRQSFRLELLRPIQPQANGTAGGRRESANIG